jgi:hypothetical protein
MRLGGAYPPGRMTFFQYFSPVWTKASVFFPPEFC